MQSSCTSTQLPLLSLLFYKWPVLLFASSPWALKQVEYVSLGKEYQQAIYRRKLKDTNLREHILFLTQQFGKNKVTDINQYWLSCEEQKTLCHVCVIFLEDIWWVVILKKILMYITFDPEITLLGTYPQEASKFTMILIETFLMLVKRKTEEITLISFKKDLVR